MNIVASNLGTKEASRAGCSRPAPDPSSKPSEKPPTECPVAIKPVVKRGRAGEKQRTGNRHPRDSNRQHRQQTHHSEPNPKPPIAN
ncbi:hypothetical protein F2Q69_00044099 [Brassica cretica]|uniref:Uncharacterized protein n=1 Tax=Brassica cretica TaxID=69181 RepID=A0A8S9NE65_BRACR|nr:hypothetical protein F2Q69_00044099 [Brassica cretica]